MLTDIQADLAHLKAALEADHVGAHASGSSHITAESVMSAVIVLTDIVARLADLFTEESG